MAHPSPSSKPDCNAAAAALHPRHGYSRPAGFTLIELMISVSLVLLLIIGINKIFQYTTQAIGSGQAISTATRDSRAAATAFNNDLSNAATTDGPFFIIHSSQTYAFRNRADYLADKDGDASTIDINGDGVEGDPTVPGEIIYPTTYNFRNHRTDVLEFFARGSYASQTGNAQFNSGATSNEARIWYGFLKQPNSSYYSVPIEAGSTAANPNAFNGSYWFPGLDRGTSKVLLTGNPSTPSSNPNNFFASDWILGRVATLLVPTIPASVGNLFYPYFTSSAVVLPKLAPLCDWETADQSNLATDSSAIQWQPQWSRTDIAQSTINSGASSYQTILTNWINKYTNQNPPYQMALWWNRMFVGPAGGGGGDLFQVNPFIGAFTNTALGTNQVTPAKMARTVPYFLKGCSQFIVEFAGDFVQQDDNPSDATYGEVTDLVTTSNGKADGIDYQLIPPNITPVPARSQWSRQIRWYGFPRNTTGTISIPGNQGASFSTTNRQITPGSSALAAEYKLTSVVPLRDMIATSATACTTLNNALNPTGIATMTPKPQWIERSWPGVQTGGNYAAAPMDYSAGHVVPAGADYMVAWGPDSDAAGIPRPKMIRITITLDDPNGRLPDGQTFQYVYTLP